MAVFRVKKTKEYTVMSNEHLKSKTLSLKAKGLLSHILSLPDDWDYSLRGLTTINKDGLDSIRSAIIELEKAGYIRRSRTRNKNGQLKGNEFIVYESPILDNPILENPTQVNPTQDNPTQINNKEINKELQNKDQSIHPTDIENENDSIDILSESVKRKIEYETLIQRYPEERVNELYGLIIETLNSRKEYIRIGGEDFPSQEVKSQFEKLNQFHIEYVIDCISQNTTRVHNIKQYLLTTLYNAPLTMDHYYTSLVNHHENGNRRY